MTIIKNQAAFKDCDIRGRYPDDVNETLFRTIGETFGFRVLQEGSGSAGDILVVMGSDHRLSTPALKRSFLEGMVCHPLKIIDLGTVPTPVVYWAKSKRLARASAIITASHNPPDFNGLKIMNGDLPPTAQDILDLARVDDTGPVAGRPSAGEKIVWADGLEEYQQEIVERFTGTGIDSLSVVIDAGSGCQAGVASRIFSRLGAAVTAIHDEPDGLFRKRLPDCAVPENLVALSSAVKAAHADLGIAFDGDGDRLAVVDGRGRVVGSERLGMILLQGPLPPQDGDVIILDIKCSMQLERIASKMGGLSVRCRSGHAYMKTMMIDRRALMGVELSGHIFLRQIEGRDDPLYTVLALCSYLAGHSLRLSDLIDDLPPIFMTPDVRLSMPPAKIEQLIADCRHGINNARVETLDGVRLVWDEGWVLVRKSITEPKVTIRLEGESMDDLETVGRRFVALRPDLASNIEQAVEGVARESRRVD